MLEGDVFISVRVHPSNRSDLHQLTGLCMHQSIDTKVALDGPRARGAPVQKLFEHVELRLLSRALQARSVEAALQLVDLLLQVP